MLIDEKHNAREKIEALTPAVSDGLIDNYVFTLMLSLNRIDDLHPITQHQCAELSKKKKLNCIFKIK